MKQSGESESYVLEIPEADLDQMFQCYVFGEAGNVDITMNESDSVLSTITGKSTATTSLAKDTTAPVSVPVASLATMDSVLSTITGTSTATTSPAKDTTAPVAVPVASLATIQTTATPSLAAVTTAAVPVALLTIKPAVSRKDQRATGPAPIE